MTPESARLRGRLRAARHSLRELREHPEAVVTSRAPGRERCDICGGPIRAGRWVDRWLRADDRDVCSHTVHPDCWEVLQSANRDEWFEGDTIEQIIADWSLSDLTDAVAGCVDPDCAFYLRRAWESGHYDDEVDDG